MNEPDGSEIFELALISADLAPWTPTMDTTLRDIYDQLKGAGEKARPMTIFNLIKKDPKGEPLR